MLNQKSSFSVYTFTSIKERIRAESKRTGESMNSIVTRRLLAAEKADKAKVKGDA